MTISMPAELWILEKLNNKMEKKNGLTNTSWILCLRGH